MVTREGYLTMERIDCCCLWFNAWLCGWTFGWLEWNGITDIFCEVEFLFVIVIVRNEVFSLLMFASSLS